MRRNSEGASARRLSTAGALLLACIAAAGLARAAGAENTGKFVWNDRLRIEFRPTDEQKKTIHDAMQAGKKSAEVKLTEEQAAWVRKNYGAAAKETKVRWLKAPPADFKVAAPQGLSYEFREFYSMECRKRAGEADCTAVRLPLQIESGPGGTRPSESILGTLKVQPVFTASQRKALEKSRREGKPDGTFQVTGAQSKALTAVGEAKAGKPMKLEFMAAPEPARILKQDKIQALGCTMNWQAWCDNYGCHELCYPQCD